MSQGDIQRAFGVLQKDFEGLRKANSDIDTKKCDKKELTEFKQKIASQIDQKAQVGEVHTSISSYISEQNQKNIELRSDVFKKVSEMQS